MVEYSDFCALLESKAVETGDGEEIPVRSMVRMFSVNM
jgi:hypothetical protein